MSKFSDDVEVFIDALEAGDAPLVEGVGIPVVRDRWLPHIHQLEAEIKTKDGALNTCAIRLGRVKAKNGAMRALLKRASRFNVLSEIESAPAWVTNGAFQQEINVLLTGESDG